MNASKGWEQRRQRLFTIIDIGSTSDFASRAYDLLYTIVTLVNLTASILYTFSEMQELCGELLLWIESITIAFFALDCILRLLTAKLLHPHLSESRAIWKYVFSFSGFVDILSFLHVDFIIEDIVFAIFMIVISKCNQFYRFVRFNLELNTRDRYSDVFCQSHSSYNSVCYSIVVGYFSILTTRIWSTRKGSTLSANVTK